MPAWTARCSTPVKLSWIIDKINGTRGLRQTIGYGPADPVVRVIFIDSQVKLC